MKNIPFMGGKQETGRPWQDPKPPVVPILGARTSFLASLSHKDLLRLRAVVRKVHMEKYPSWLQNDHEADRIIETLGEQTSQKLIKDKVDGLIK